MRERQATQRRGRYRISEFFLHATDPANLAVARILVFSVIALRFSVAPLLLGDLPAELIRMPLGMHWAQSLVPRDTIAVMSLATIVRMSASMAVIGLFTRLSTATAAFSACLLFVIPNMYGHVGHDRHHLIWFAMILAASPCGDRLSIDALLRRRLLPSAPAVRYGFPIRMMLLTMGVAYFFAGFWKLAHVGVAWFWSDSLRNLAAKLAYAGVGGHAEILIASPWLTSVAGFGVMLFELGFIGLLWFRVGRVVAIAAAVAFHLGTYYLLGISFGQLLVCYPAFVDLAGWWRRWRGTPPPASIAAHDRPSFLQIAVAALVLGGNLTLGALHVGAGWPFASYPRFDVLHTPRVTSYVVEAETADGGRIRLHDSELGGPVFGRHFYNLFRANEARVADLEEPDGRESRWRSLCAFAWTHHPQLLGTVRPRFILDDVDLTQGPDRPIHLRERTLFACAPDPAP